MSEWICTFGFGHVHPTTGEAMANKYVVIESDNAWEARDHMFRRYGKRWAFVYESRADAGVDKHGLVEFVDLEVRDRSTSPGLRCTMLREPDAPECGKSARRAILSAGGGPEEVVCDDCFKAMVERGDFTRTELETQYPLVLEEEGEVAMPRKQEIPGPTLIEKNLADLPPMVTSAGYDVFSWRNGPAHSAVPVTEVHLVLPLGDTGGFVALRLKSPRALDELVGVLLNHRKEVWPGQ